MIRLIPLILLVSAVAMNAVADEPAKPPVILLTGFAPFEGKAPNPSWEGIKKLDGVEWQGYRLVARELPVVWGQPLAHLAKHIEEHQPVAIFSFGKGGGWAIETVGRNARGRGRDTDGKFPPEPKVAADGPDRYNATIDAAAIAKLLTEKKGRTIALSTNAGQYLCDECLYTLEHLKATKKLSATVMFCHTPGLSQDFTADDVQAFVLDLLDCWRLHYHATADAAEDDDAARTAEVKKFVEHYFSTWSKNQMDAYADCFLNEAVVQFIDERGKLTTQAKRPFIADQRSVQSKIAGIETPERIEIRFERGIARAVVYWKLVVGERVDYGYDHFTLAHQGEGKWKIVNLLFYKVEKE